MQKFEGFKAERSAAREQLPVGGYVAKIMGAKEETYSWGNVLVISFDIAEGQYKDFFANDYRNNDREDKKWRGTYRLNEPKDDGSEKDSWTKRTFGGAIWSIEQSNSGYHWDWNEAGLKGKTVGVLFRNEEWKMNGNTGWGTKSCALESVENVRAGKFKMPKDKPLKNKQSGTVQTAHDDAMQSVEDDGDLPF